MPIDAIALAQSSTTATGFREAVLCALQRDVGFEAAFFLTPALGDSAVLGLPRDRFLAAAASSPSYTREVLPIKACALARRGVAIDTEVLGESRRACSYFRDFAEPIGGRHSLMAFPRLRGEVIGGLMLGRTGRAFDDDEVRTIEELLPGLAVAHASFRGASLTTLSEREREILDYLCLGYTNREIASACGTSANTVRNQLVSVYEKLGASTRAEAVAIARG